MKGKSIWIRVLYVGWILIFLFCCIVYALGKRELTRIYYSEDQQAQALDVLGEITDEFVVKQSFINPADYIKGIIVRFANYGNIPEGTITLSLQFPTGENISQTVITAKELHDNEDYYFSLGESKKILRGQKLDLVIVGNGGKPGAAVTLWTALPKEGYELTFNGENRDQTIFLILDAYRDGHFDVWFWSLFVLLFLGFTTFSLIGYLHESRKVKSVSNEFIHIFDKYSFLLEQLVSRDFKNKYRRSYLGILWSLLNPLLMMGIVSAVFSFVFRFDIKNFQVYLILGQVMFNFFSEATQVGVTTIIGSGQLIKKVYLPKYIFPLSKTIFSFVNFLISFLAVAAVLFFYKINLTWNVLLLPFLLITYFLFTLGICLILSALMVFMRDTQHFYTIALTGWSYLTPIFYPVSSLSPWMQKIMMFNPLYHYLNFLRKILLYGTTPTIQEMMFCIIIAVISLGIGMNFFYKQQNKFILHI